MPDQNMKIIFPYDTKKAHQAILWLLHKNGGAMDKLKLVKLIFLADREHLVRYGRPIVGGNYYAMDLGPVSSELKEEVDKSSVVKDFPFKIQGRYNLVAKEPVDEDWLSESDMEILDEIYSKKGHIDSVKLGLMTHKLKAWIKNQPPQKGRKLIPYEDFIEDDEDKSILEIIRDDQEARDC